MMKKIFLIFIILTSVKSVYSHKSYISISDYEYNSKTKEIEASLKITAHDFEYILEKKFNKRIHIEQIVDSSIVGQYLQLYLKKNIQISSAGQQTEFNYVGKQVNLRDELHFFFTFKHVLNPSSILVRNTLLFDLFSKQQNIIHYKYGGVLKSITLFADKSSGKIDFN